MIYDMRKDLAILLAEHRAAKLPDSWASDFLSDALAYRIGGDAKALIIEAGGEIGAFAQDRGRSSYLPLAQAGARLGIGSEEYRRAALGIMRSIQAKRAHGAHMNRQLSAAIDFLDEFCIY